VFLCEEKGAMPYAEPTMRSQRLLRKNKAHLARAEGRRAAKKMPAWTEVRRATLGRQQLRFTNE